MRKPYPFPASGESSARNPISEDQQEFSYAYQRRSKYRVPYLHAITRFSEHIKEDTGDELGALCRRVAITGALIGGEQEIPVHESVAVEVMHVMSSVSAAMARLKLRERLATSTSSVSMEDDEISVAECADEYYRSIHSLLERNDMHLFLGISGTVRHELSSALQKLMDTNPLRLHTRSKPRAIEGIDQPRYRIAEDVARPGDYVVANLVSLRDRLLIKNPRGRQKYISGAEGIALEMNAPDSLLVLSMLRGVSRCSFKGLKVIPDIRIAEDPEKAHYLNVVRRLLDAGEPVEAIAAQMQNQA